MKKISTPKDIVKLFVESALTETNIFHDTESIKLWLKEKGETNKGSTIREDLDQLKGWEYKKNNTILRHKSGRFFSIFPIEITTNWGRVATWTQPIMAQPEIGLLGIIAKEIEGTLYFLMQAKCEPGNVNVCQLSPTLQATKSNYTQVHHGLAPRYLEYFLDNDTHPVLLDQLQSEHGARFLKKRNRNTIIYVADNVKTNDNFRWLTLGQIKKLSQVDNLVNMDTRTVISAIPFADLERYRPNNSINHFLEKIEDQFKKKLFKSAAGIDKPLHSLNQVKAWLTKLKFKYELEVRRIALCDLTNWQIRPSHVEHAKKRHFNVIGVNVSFDDREVKNWSQPLIQPVSIGLCAFLIKKIDGVYHFLVQGKLECGNFDIVELAPTVQCMSDKNSLTVNRSDGFIDYVVNADQSQIRYNALHSEEGGRFFHYQNRYIVIEIDSNTDIQENENFIWVSFRQLTLFLQFSNTVNIHARSIIAMLSFS